LSKEKKTAQHYLSHIAGPEFKMNGSVGSFNYCC